MPPSRVSLVLGFCLSLAASAQAGDLDVQAHRGGRGLLPENTLPAFEHALTLGVTTLELDLQVTRDRALVVYHDQHLDSKRCTRDDGGRVPANPIRDLLFEDLADIDCGSRTPRKFPDQRKVPGARIPTFDQVLELAAGAGYPVRFNVEIKMQKENLGIPADEFVSLVVESIRSHDLVERTTIQSFRPGILAEVGRLEPGLKLAALVRSRSHYESSLEASGATILSPKFTHLRREDVKRFQERGIEILPWTVNEPGDIRRMIEWGVDGIISDYPDRVIEILGDDET